jgi:two-component system nitrogen regulation response regulator GlnG
MTGVNQDTFGEWRRHLETETRPEVSAADGAQGLVVPLLTVLCHADPDRAGEQAWLPQLAESRSAELSRLEPLFHPPVGGEPRPLAEPRMSRRPMRISPRPEGLLLDSVDSRCRFEVDGEPLEGSRLLSKAELGRGVVLLVGGRITLLLHSAEASVQRPPDFGLIGESAGIVRLRRQIQAVADLEVPVLLLGESGTGKELVASALQASGPRRDRPWISVNMSAVPPSLAAAELFGTVKGAFSGAERSRQGFFRAADGGTLFLDEIGETPLEVQALLLRALESGEIQPVGAQRTTKVDVRVIAATDSDLEGAIRRGTFREPLLQRLRSYEIVLPPLRERRDDLGRLFFHFLRQEMARIGETERLESCGPYGRAFVPARLLAEMAVHPWPGNVRGLRNAVRQLAIASRGAETLEIHSWRERIGTAGAGADTAVRFSPFPEATPPNPATDETPEPKPRTRKPAPARRYRDPTDVGEEELTAALRVSRWNLKATAATLGISRTSLYLLIERSPDLRKAGDLAAEEIERARQRVGPSLDKLADALNVSKQGLKRRIGQLGL